MEKNKPKFEEALKELEGIIEELEGGELTLDESLGRYERGVKALTACRNRFPGIGGFIIWMGHDSFPCLANTSILDFHGDPKPAAFAIQEILNRK